MSYIVYTTEGYVLQSFPKGEESRTVYVFSREFGLLSVHAQGVRKGNAKLRFGLEPFSLLSFSFVRGRAGWRVIDTEELVSARAIKSDKRKLVLAARTLTLLRRLIGVEDAARELFDEVRAAFFALGGEGFDEKDMKRFEMILVAKILHQLGYLPDKKHFRGDAGFIEALVHIPSWDGESLGAVAGREKELVHAINQSLLASQL